MNKTTRALTEAALISALTSIIGITSIYVPILGIFMFLVPLPLIIIARRQGIKYSVLSLATSSVVILMFSTPITALFLIFLPGIPAIIMGIYMNRGKSPGKILIVGILTGMVTIIISLAITQEISGMPIQESMEKAMSMQMDMTDAIYSKIPVADQGQLEKAKMDMEKSMEMAMQLIPALLLLWSSILCLINYQLSHKILKRIGNPIEPLPSFREFRLPRTTIVGILLMLVLAIISSRLEILDEETIVSNVMMIAQVIFCIQGMAVIFYYMHLHKLSNLLKTVITLFLLFSGVGMIGAMFLGMVDVGFDFRKRLEQRIKK